MTKLLYLAGILLIASSSVFAADEPAFTVLSTMSQPDDGKPSPTESDGRMLLAFWRADCAPCVEERPILKEIAKQNPTLKVALVTLSGDANAQRHFPPPTEPNMEIWASESDADTTLLQMGDIRRVLPFSVFMRKDGSVCDRHYGLLGTDKAAEWMVRC